MFLQRLVGEDPGWADLRQIAAEFVLQNSILGSPEIDLIARPEDIEIAPSGVVAIKANAAITLDAAVHLVIDEGAEILVTVRSLFETEVAIRMPGHGRHILQMAFAAFIAHRAIVRMVDHQPFDHAGSKRLRLLVFNRDARAVGSGRHTGHDQLSSLVLGVLELLDGALPAGAHRTQRGMPAEIRQVESQRQTGVEQVLPVLSLIGLILHVDGRHQSSPWAPLLANMPFKILSEIFQRALQRLHRAGRERAKRVAGAEKPGVALEFLQVTRFSLSLLDGL